MNWVIGCSDEGKYHFISPDHEDEKEMEDEKKKEKEVADDDHNGYITCSL
jgi:hypothetical protein